jgi:hypothetical protein
MQEKDQNPFQKNKPPAGNSINSNSGVKNQIPKPFNHPEGTSLSNHGNSKFIIQFIAKSDFDNNLSDIMMPPSIIQESFDEEDEFSSFHANSKAKKNDPKEHEPLNFMNHPKTPKKAPRKSNGLFSNFKKKRKSQINNLNPFQIKGRTKFQNTAEQKFFSINIVNILEVEKRRLALTNINFIILSVLFFFLLSLKKDHIFLRLMTNLIGITVSMISLIMINKRILLSTNILLTFHICFIFGLFLKLFVLGYEFFLDKQIVDEAIKSIIFLTINAFLTLTIWVRASNWKKFVAIGEL